MKKSASKEDGLSKVDSEGNIANGCACTVLYCTALYCTLLYCAPDVTDRMRRIGLHTEASCGGRVVYPTGV
eukprot:1012993-Pyramimonas_sp.AAC.1